MITKTEDMCFDNFEVRRGNRASLAMAKRLLENPEEHRLAVFCLSAAEGLHLKHAIQNAWDRPFFSTSAAEIAQDLMDAVYGKTHAAWLEKYTAPDILIIDDLLHLAQKEATQQELYKLLKLRLETKKCTVIFAGCPITQLASEFREELLDFLKMGVATE